MRNFIIIIKIAAASIASIAAAYNQQKAPKGIELSPVLGYRYILPGPPNCEVKMMCSTVPSDLCKYGTVYLWGMNAQHLCNVPVYKLP